MAPRADRNGQAAKPPKPRAQATANATLAPPTWLEVLKIAPQIFWVLLVVAIIIVFREPALRALQQNSVTKLGVGILQIEFAQRQIQAAATTKSQEIPAALRNRIERTALKILGTTILWVDDNPSNNLAERRALTSLGVVIDTAKSTTEAIKILEVTSYTIIISDEFRKEDAKAACFAANDQFQPANAGCDLMRKTKELFEKKGGNRPAFIFYAGLFDRDWGTPVHAFGITSQVDELFHLILDAVERQGST
jgi:hypothetical protein